MPCRWPTAAEAAAQRACPASPALPCPACQWPAASHSSSSASPAPAAPAGINEPTKKGAYVDTKDRVGGGAGTTGRGI